jgi:predicted ferric reductase
MNSSPWDSFIRPLATFLLVIAVFVLMLLALWAGQSFGSVSFAQSLRALFALDSVQLWWYVTRAAGLTGYFLLWLSMAWGLAIPSRIAQPLLEGTFTYDFHEYLSLLGLGFVFVHVAVLLLDKYLPFSLAQILIPFVDTYRAFWVGLGIISFYIFLLVTLTFYLRQRIGVKAFRFIHLLSLVGYLGATLHGLFAGTDSALPVAKLLYASTFLIITFLTVYWLVVRQFGDGDEQAHITTRVGIRKQDASGPPRRR